MTKYNRILPESEGNVLCFEIGERVTMDDYTTFFMPALTKRINDHSDVKILLSYTRPFLGWDIDAASNDIETVTNIGKSYKKLALVNPPESVLQRWLTLKPLLGGEIRKFEEGEFDQALTWLKS